MKVPTCITQGAIEKTLQLKRKALGDDWINPKNIQSFRDLNAALHASCHLASCANEANPRAQRMAALSKAVKILKNGVASSKDSKPGGTSYKTAYDPLVEYQFYESLVFVVAIARSLGIRGV